MEDEKMEEIQEVTFLKVEELFTEFREDISIRSLRTILKPLSDEDKISFLTICFKSDIFQEIELLSWYGFFYPDNYDLEDDYDEEFVWSEHLTLYILNYQREFGLADSEHTLQYYFEQEYPFENLYYYFYQSDHFQLYNESFRVLLEGYNKENKLRNSEITPEFFEQTINVKKLLYRINLSVCNTILSEQQDDGGTISIKDYADKMNLAISEHMDREFINFFKNSFLYAPTELNSTLTLYVDTFNAKLQEHFSTMLKYVLKNEPKQEQPENYVPMISLKKLKYFYEQ